MVRKALFVSITAILLGVTSCSKVASPCDKSITLAMLAQGITFDDHAFLSSCKAGVEKAKSEFSLTCEYDIDSIPSGYLGRLEHYADLNYDLIIAVGYMWEGALVQAAKQYPNSDFVLVDAELSEQQSNTANVVFNVDEVAYPLGYLSAWWAFSQDREDPAVGFVGAMEIPQIRQFTEPYRSGVDHFNRDFGTSVASYGAYSGTFINPDVGGHVADSLITLGADLILGVGGQTGNGALLMAKQREKWGIGVDVDQYYSLPEVSDILISSAMKRLDNALYSVIKSSVENKFSDIGQYTGNLLNSGVQIAPYHNFEPEIADSIKLRIDQIKAGIMDGTIETGFRPIGAGTLFSRADL